MHKLTEEDSPHFKMRKTKWLIFYTIFYDVLQTDPIMKISGAQSDWNTYTIVGFTSILKESGSYTKEIFKFNI